MEQNCAQFDCVCRYFHGSSIGGFLELTKRILHFVSSTIFFVNDIVILNSCYSYFTFMTALAYMQLLIPADCITPVLLGEVFSEQNSQFFPCPLEESPFNVHSCHKKAKAEKSVCLYPFLLHFIEYIFLIYRRSSIIRCISEATINKPSELKEIHRLLLMQRYTSAKMLVLSSSRLSASLGMYLQGMLATKPIIFFYVTPHRHVSGRSLPIEGAFADGWPTICRVIWIISPNQRINLCPLVPQCYLASVAISVCNIRS